MITFSAKSSKMSCATKLRSFHLMNVALKCWPKRCREKHYFPLTYLYDLPFSVEFPRSNDRNPKKGRLDLVELLSQVQPTAGNVLSPLYNASATATYAATGSVFEFLTFATSNVKKKLAKVHAIGQFWILLAFSSNPLNPRPIKSKKKPTLSHPRDRKHH